MSIETIERTTGRPVTTMTPADIETGLRLQALRRTSGLSQVELGDAIGVTFQQIGKLERGQNRISIERMKAICEVCGVDLSYFVGELSVSDRYFVSLARDGQFIELLSAFERIKKPSDRNLVLAMAEALASK